MNNESIYLYRVNATALIVGGIYHSSGGATGARRG